MKILLPVDGSEHSFGAARFLSQLSLTPEDKVTVLHVINFIPLVHEIEAYADTVFRIKQEIAPRILEEASDILRSTPVKLEQVTDEGNAADLIVDRALDDEYDLIVLGAKGTKGLGSFIVGSTTRTVVSRSPIPVLAVRERQWEINRPFKVLFADDGSEYSEVAGRFLVKLPLPQETEVGIIHVVQSAVHDIPERFFIEVDDRWKTELARIREDEFRHAEGIIEKAESYLRERFSDIKTVIKVGDPSIEIISYTERHEVDLLVVGCRGVKGLRGRLGSVSRNVIRHAPASFLIGKSC
ncbi:MAG: universal stress protein [Nitrospirae bacterium]|nr:MAG: universal stress protein [Nitrospirota bacterium]